MEHGHVDLVALATLAAEGLACLGVVFLVLAESDADLGVVRRDELVDLMAYLTSLGKP